MPEEESAESVSVSIKELGTVEKASLFMQEAVEGLSCSCKPFIYIVDDTEFNIVPVKLMIQEHYGLGISVAPNGKIAYDTLQKQMKLPCNCQFRAPRLIIMDIGMPVMDGIQASKLILELQQRYKEKDLTHIVTLTSFTTKKHVTDCLAVGIKKVYFKPLSLGNLNEIMANHFFRDN